MQDDLEVLIICLEPEATKLHHVKTYFPQAKTLTAVNMRGIEPNQLFESKQITAAAYHSMSEGRRWKKEISASAEIGLYKSNLLALSQTLDKALLLLEEDCRFVQDPRPHVHLLLQSEAEVANLGCLIKSSARGDLGSVAPGMPAPWRDITKSTVAFHHTHCVFYSKLGRSKALQLYGCPVQWQLDWYLSFLAQEGKLRTFINPTLCIATQPFTLFSSLDHKLPSLCFSFASGIIFLLLSITVLLLSYAWNSMNIG